MLVAVGFISGGFFVFKTITLLYFKQSVMA